MPPPMRNGLMCSASHLGPPLRAPGQTVVSLVYQQMQETGSLSYPPSIRKSRTINQEIRCPLALRTLQPISDINLGQISALITVKWYTGNRNVLKLQFPFLIGISFYSVTFYPIFYSTAQPGQPYACGNHPVRSQSP